MWNQDKVFKQVTTLLYLFPEADDGDLWNFSKNIDLALFAHLENISRLKCRQVMRIFEEKWCCVSGKQLQYLVCKQKKNDYVISLFKKYMKTKLFCQILFTVNFLVPRYGTIADLISHQ